MGWFDINADKPSAIIKKPKMSDEARKIYIDAMHRAEEKNTGLVIHLSSICQLYVRGYII